MRYYEIIAKLNDGSEYTTTRRNKKESYTIAKRISLDSSVDVVNIFQWNIGILKLSNHLRTYKNGKY